MTNRGNLAGRTYLERVQMTTLSEALALQIARRLDAPWDDLFMVTERVA